MPFGVTGEAVVAARAVIMIRDVGVLDNTSQPLTARRERERRPQGFNTPCLTTDELSVLGPWFNMNYEHPKVPDLATRYS